MIKNRILAVFLAIALLVTQLPIAPILAETADKSKVVKNTEIEQHKNKELLAKWLDKGWLVGDDKGKINADVSITRAEFVAMVNRVKGFSDPISDSEMSQYSDVKKGDWFYNEMAVAVKQGYMKGVSANELAPNATITAEQLIAIAMRLAPKEAGQAQIDDKKLSSLNEVSDWAKVVVKDALSLGFVANDDMAGALNQNATRVLGMLWLDRVLENNRVISVSGEYHLGEIANLMVNAKEVKLDKTNIKGNLLFTVQTTEVAIGEEVTVGGLVESEGKTLVKIGKENFSLIDKDKFQAKGSKKIEDVLKNNKTNQPIIGGGSGGGSSSSSTSEDEEGGSSSTKKTMADQYKEKFEPIVVTQNAEVSITMIEQVIPKKENIDSIRLLDPVDTSKVGKVAVKLELIFKDKSKKNTTLMVDVRKALDLASQYKNDYSTTEAVRITVSAGEYESVLNIGKLNVFTRSKVSEALKLDEAGKKLGEVKLDIVKTPSNDKVGDTLAKVKLSFKDKSSLELDVPVKVEPLPIHYFTVRLLKSMPKQYAPGSSIDFSKVRSYVTVSNRLNHDGTWSKDGSATVDVEYTDFERFGLKIVKRGTETEVPNMSKLEGDLVVDGKIAIDVLRKDGIMVKEQGKERMPIEGLEVKELNKADLYKAAYPKANTASMTVSAGEFESQLNIAKLNAFTREKASESLKMNEASQKFGDIGMTIVTNPDNKKVGTSVAKAKLTFSDKSSCEVDIPVKVEPLPVHYFTAKLLRSMPKEYALGSAIDFTKVRGIVVVSNRLNHDGTWSKDGSTAVEVNYADFETFGLKIVKRGTEVEIPNMSKVEGDLVVDGKIVIDVFRKDGIMVKEQGSNRVALDGLSIKEEARDKASEYAKAYPAPGKADMSVVADKYEEKLKLAKINVFDVAKAEKALKVEEAKKTLGNMTTEIITPPVNTKIGEGTARVKLSFDDQSTLEIDVPVTISPLPVNGFTIKLADGMAKSYPFGSQLDLAGVGVVANVSNSLNPEGGWSATSGVDVDVPYEDFALFGLEVVKKNKEVRLKNNSLVQGDLVIDKKIAIDVYRALGVLDISRAKRVAVEGLEVTGEDTGVGDPTEGGTYRFYTLNDAKKLDMGKTYPDGIYHGNGVGMHGNRPIPVKVTVANGKITNIEAKVPDLKIDDGDPYYKKFYVVKKLILADQNPQLISYQFKSTREAVNAVLAEAEGKERTRQTYLDAFDKVLGKHEFGGEGKQKRSFRAFILEDSDPEITYQEVERLVGVYVKEELGYSAIDAVSAGTRTGTGTALAVENALYKANADVDILNIELENTYKTEYTEGNKLDLSGLSVKFYMKDGSTKSIPYDKFEENNLKIYLQRTDKELKNGITLTDEGLGAPTRYGIKPILIHEPSKDFMILPSMIIYEPSYPLTAQKVQLSAVGSEDWLDVKGFKASEFRQTLLLSAAQIQALTNKEVEFRLITKTPDNTSKVWPLTYSKENLKVLTLDTVYYTSIPSQVIADEKAKDKKPYSIRFPNLNITLVEDTAASTEADGFTPTVTNLEVAKNTEVTVDMVKKAITNLPSTATLTLKQAVDTTKVGSIVANAVVVFADKSTKDIEVGVKVIGMKTEWEKELVIEIEDQAPANQTLKFIIEFDDQGKISRIADNQSVVRKADRMYFRPSLNMMKQFVGKSTPEELESIFKASKAKPGLDADEPAADGISGASITARGLVDLVTEAMNARNN